VNVFWQEVFAIQKTFGLSFSWQVARSPLEQAYGKSLFWLRLRHPLLAIDRHQYLSGGADQIKLCIHGVGAALRLFDNPHFVKSARLMNLRLMRKGLCNNSRHHCIDLADQIIG
jgi:hypothetical protein